MTVDIRSLIKLARETRQVTASKADTTKGLLSAALDLTSLNECRPNISVTLGNSASQMGISISNDFVSVPVADALMDAFERAEPSFYQLRGRRCLPIGGRVTTAGLIPADDIPPWMNSLFDHVFEHVLGPVGLPRPNHALVNVYEPGEGIMAHEDGPAYTPYASILSLGSSSVFDFVEKSTERRSVARVYLPVGSLLLFRDSAYTDVLHEFRHDSHDRICEDVLNHRFDGVEERLGRSRLVSPNLLARGKRISITMRHVSLAPRN